MALVQGMSGHEPSVLQMKCKTKSLWAFVEICDLHNYTWSFFNVSQQVSMILPNVILNHLSRACTTGTGEPIPKENGMKLAREAGTDDVQELR